MQAAQLRMSRRRQIARARKAMNFFSGEIAELSLTAGGPIQRAVMQQNVLAIFGKPHIDLSPGDEIGDA